MRILPATPSTGLKLVPACPCFIDSGLYLPSIRSEGIDAIAVIIDTSGSLDPDTLAAFWSEVREVATEIEPERVILLQVDTAVRDAAEYAAGDLPEEITVKGRGGTDFRPGFAWLEERDIQPGVCLYFTDLKCSRYPEAEPACRSSPPPPASEERPPCRLSTLRRKPSAWPCRGSNAP